MGPPTRKMLPDLVAAARFMVPDDLAGFFSTQGEALGASRVGLYLVDYEQRLLIPLPPGNQAEGPLRIDSTLGGRCFGRLEVQLSDDGKRIWVPILDGSERLGVACFDFADERHRATDDELNAFAAVVAELLMAKDSYGDLFRRVRQRRPMSLEAEMAWNLLPPLTFATDRVVIACMVAPVYEIAGDSFDYAVDATTARFAVFDAMGHGMAAGMLATVAVGAYRKARHDGLDLPETVAAIDEAVATCFPGEQFVTAIVAELDLPSGRLSWHNAGHPVPLLLRDGHVVKHLAAQPGSPLGLGELLGSLGPRAIACESLEPADRILLFTDGVTEGRSVLGEEFGSDRLGDLVSRQADAGRPAPETMRQLMHAVIDYQEGRLRDDATTVLVEWKTGGAERIAP